MTHSTATKLKAIIVDDEKTARIHLSCALKAIPLVELVGEATNVPDAVKLIHKEKPNVVFLDIEMPGYSGLQLLDFFNKDEITFTIIFVTAYNEYAIQAFKMSAFDYLLKPVEDEILEQTIERYTNQEIKSKTSSQIALLKNIFKEERPINKVAISSVYGVEFVNVDDIISFEAKGNYTEVIDSDQNTILTSKPLTDFESMLEPFNLFFRTHRSAIVNIKAVNRLNTKDGLYLELTNGSCFPLSRNRKKAFDKMIKDGGL